MDDAALSPIHGRVAELRRRHLVIAGVTALVGVAALGAGAVLGEAEAPIGARIFLCAGGLAVAAWQLWLATKIGRGLAALRGGRTVTWIYVLHASIDGTRVASSVMIGLDGGERLELPLGAGVDPKAIVEAVARAHPRASVGFDAATEARFLADPRSVLRS